MPQLRSHHPVHPAAPRRAALGLLLGACLAIGACGGGGSGDAASSPGAVTASAIADEAAEALPALVLADSGSKSALAVAAPTDPRALELAYLGGVMGSELLPYAHLEVPAVTNLRAFSDAAGTFLGLRTYAGQPLTNSGLRAETSVDFPFREGETVRYSWRFGITPDFQADPDNRWWLFGDLHDQPDVTRGETWAGFPAHSPSVGLAYGRVNGKDSLGLLYGVPDPTVRGAVTFTRGVWHQVVMDIVWSRGASGSIAVYIDGAKKPALQASGANMYNAYQHYLKLGSYREPNIAGDSWVYVRDVKIVRVAP